MRVSGEPGFNPLPPLRATGWRTDSGTLTLTLSRRERGSWTQPFNPLRDTPSMMWRWAKMKRTIAGMLAMTPPAMITG